MNVATHSFSLGSGNEVAEQNTDLGGQSAQQLKIAAMPFDERKTFAATKEDLEQNTADLPVVMQRQVPVIQKAQRTVDVPLLQYIDTTVDVPVAKQREDCMTRSTTKSRWTRSCVPPSSQPRARSRLSSTVRVRDSLEAEEPR